MRHVSSEIFLLPLLESQKPESLPLFHPLVQTGSVSVWYNQAQHWFWLLLRWLIRSVGNHLMEWIIDYTVGVHSRTHFLTICNMDRPRIF